MRKEDERLVYSVPEVARMLGIGRITAYNLAKRANFPAITIGKRIVIPKAALERWLNNQG